MKSFSHFCFYLTLYTEFLSVISDVLFFDYNLSKCCNKQTAVMKKTIKQMTITVYTIGEFSTL